MDVNYIEKLLDVFFALSYERIYFDPISPNLVHTKKAKSICQLTFCKIHEKENSKTTLEKLTEIDNPTVFGKHIASYEAMLYYYKSLTGQYQQLKDWLSRKELALTDNEKTEWFYNKIKVYQADFDIMVGDFKKAKSSLLLLKNGFLTDEDSYNIERTLGHIYRFNMDLERAQELYSNCRKTFSNNIIVDEYLETNLCETMCYFPDRTFIKEAKKIIKGMSIPINVKNKAKVMSSLAITCSIKRDYKSAEKYIKDSLEIYRNDGYKSGELFSYMAKAYLEYGQKGEITQYTENEILELIEQTGVYSFFELPLALMHNDNKKIERLKEQFEWLDFEKTIENYQKFLNSLSDSRKI